MPDHMVANPDADAAVTTALIQAAIDHVHRVGGGRVVLAAGQRFVVGTIELRSQVTLHLEPGSVLVASTRRGDYRELSFGGEYGGTQGAFIILAQDCDDISITGTGVIDGHADAWMDGFVDPDQRFLRQRQDWRPRGIGFYHCRRVHLEQFTMRDLPQWTIHLTACAHVLCLGLQLFNRLDVPNCDGIDPDRCHDVRIIGCHIEAGDDCIVLKNTKEFIGRWPEREDCSDIVVQGCTLISTSAALKIGTESQGDFRRISFVGNIIRGSHRGVALQLRDHGTIEDVLISDTIVETRRFYTGWWGNGEIVAITCVPRTASTRPGTIRRVRIRNLIGRGENGIVIYAATAHAIQDITFSDVDVVIATTSRWPGGSLDLRPMNGAEHGGLERHPEAGFLAHNVDGLVLKDVRIRRVDDAPWYGPLRKFSAVDGLVERDCRWD